MNLGLEGQAAIVAGGASGIGKAIAEAFAAEGCLVERSTEPNIPASTRCKLMYKTTLHYKILRSLS